MHTMIPHTSRLLLTLTLIILGSLGLQAQSAIAISENSHDFGEVTKGNPVTHEFILTNNSEEPLIIVDVSKPCGCQTAEFTKKAIAPGETGFVKATYNAAKAGAFVKAFTVKHNQGESKVTLRGKVVDDGNAEGSPEKTSIFSNPQ